MHGHNWRVRVTVRVDASQLDATGIGVDFRVVEQAARNAVADFDHAYLNDLEPFRTHAPSAEHVAAVICERVGQQLAAETPAARVDHIDVWETPQFRVTFHPE